MIDLSSLTWCNVWHSFWSRIAETRLRYTCTWRWVTASLSSSKITCLVSGCHVVSALILHFSDFLIPDSPDKLSSPCHLIASNFASSFFFFKIKAHTSVLSLLYLNTDSQSAFHYSAFAIETCIFSLMSVLIVSSFSWYKIVFFIVLMPWQLRKWSILEENLHLSLASWVMMERVREYKALESSLTDDAEQQF